MDKKILYVCTYWGVRSQIAELLTQALDIPGLIAESAGFETGTIGDLPIKAMSLRGLDLPRTAPPTLFECSRKDGDYDYVITLCNQQTQENYQVLYDTVALLFTGSTQIIHWNVADFMAIGQLEPNERLQAASEILDDIEDHIIDFVNDSVTTQRTGVTTGS